MKSENPKRGSRISRSELKTLEFLNGVQAAAYCHMSRRTFYYYVEAGYIDKYERPCNSGGKKTWYLREQLDTVLRPRRLMEKAIYIQEQNTTSLTAKKRRSCPPTIMP